MNTFKCSNQFKHGLNIFFLEDAFSSLNVTESLAEIHVKETENPNVGDDQQREMISSFVLHDILTVKEINRCNHISCVTPDRIWLSDDKNNLILKNTSGDTLHRRKDIYSGHLYSGDGIHDVNSDNDLIYIDRENNINKLSSDMKTKTQLIKRTYITWIPRCLHWSSTSRELLVGLYKDDPRTGKIVRYNHDKYPIQTIQHDITGLELYSKPIYITENNNGDVIVSDTPGAVVVTDHEGRHRFSYTGHPPGSGFGSCGVCTDTFSQILVCDHKNESIHIINKDGQFLSHLLTKLQGLFKPWCMCYVVDCQILMIGSIIDNRVYFYKYKTRQDALDGMSV